VLIEDGLRKSLHNVIEFDNLESHVSVTLCSIDYSTHLRMLLTQGDDDFLHSNALVRHPRMTLVV
jgi:hypothetical protein